MAAGKSIIPGTFIHCLLMDVYGCNKNMSLQIKTLQKQRSMAAQRAEASILFQPRKLSAGRADPFVPGGRLTAYRLALTVKGSGYGPGSRTLSLACSTPGATTPGVVPPTPPGPALPAPEESTYTRAKCQQGRRPNPSCRSGPDVSPCDGCDE